jgi:hypothetical protein
MQYRIYHEDIFDSREIFSNISLAIETSLVYTASMVKQKATRQADEALVACKIPAPLLAQMRAYSKDNGILFKRCITIACLQFLAAHETKEAAK